MAKALSIAAQAVPWVLTLFGSPLPPGVAEGLSTAAEVVEAIPKNRKRLRTFVAQAAQRFDDECAQEGSALADADRESVQEGLIARLDKTDRPHMLGAALLGEEPFTSALLSGDEPAAQWSEDERGYAVAIAGRIHALTLRFAQSPEVIAVASTAAVRTLRTEIAARPTRDQVQELIRQAVSQEIDRRPIIVGVRPRVADPFVARDELASIAATLADGEVATLCAVHGMRGVGKSQLASAYAESCEHNEWCFVGWVDASSPHGIVQELANIAVTVQQATLDDDPERAATVAINWLNSASGDRLLVFDNVDDLNDLNGRIPRGRGMRTLVTTSSRTTTTGTPISLGVYSEKQAVDYLLAQTGETDATTAALIAEDLGYLAVALTQAVTAMHLYKLDLGSYHKALGQNPLDDVTEREQGDTYPRKIGKALRLAYEAVLSAIDGTSDLNRSPGVGKAILHAMCLLAASGVPRAWLVALAEDPLTGSRAIGRLIEHSILIESDDRSIVSLHRLMAQVVREDIPEEQRPAAVDAATVVLVAAAPGDDAGYIQRRELLSLRTSQILAIREQPYSHLLVDDTAFLAVVGSTIHLANDLGHPYPAIELAGYLANTERVLGLDHPDTLTSRNNLAYAYESAGDLGRAIPLYEQTLTDRERVLGPDHPHTLASRNNLAAAYQAVGDLAGAIPLFEQTLTDRGRVLGPDHPDTLASRNNLAAAYQAAGDLGRAIPLFEQTLTDRERVLGPDHPDTLTSRNNLAYAYRSAGDLGRAIPFHEQTLTDRGQVLGPDHPHTLASRNNLAAAYESAGDLRQAIPLFQQNLTDMERVLGTDHPSTFTSRNNLAAAYRSAGDLRRAIPLFEQTLTDRERVLGPDHPDTLISRNNLASAYQAAGDLDRAVPLHEQTLTHREWILGPDHPDTLTSRNNLANAYQAAGNLEKAIPFHQKALTETERVLGPDHPDTHTSRNNLAAAYESAGDLGKAITLYEQTLTHRERILGPEHPDTLTSHNNLAVAYWATGRQELQEKALATFAAAAESAQRSFGPDHEVTRVLVGNAAAARQALGHGQSSA